MNQEHIICFYSPYPHLWTSNRADNISVGFPQTSQIQRDDSFRLFNAILKLRTVASHTYVLRPLSNYGSYCARDYRRCQMIFSIITTFQFRDFPRSPICRFFFSKLKCVHKARRGCFQLLRRKLLLAYISAQRISSYVVTLCG